MLFGVYELGFYMVVAIKESILKTKTKTGVKSNKYLFSTILPGCDLPSLPRDVEQVGATFGEKPTGYDLFLW